MVVDVQVIDGITIVTTYQEFDLAGSMAILQFLSDHNLYQYRLYDYRHYSWHLNHDEVLELSSFSKKIFPEKNYVSFCAQDDLAYATLREFSVYREQEGHSDVSVFRSREDSLNWLVEKKACEESTVSE